MGSENSGVKRVLQRTSGSNAPEDGYERQKRICRSLDSRCRSDVAWSLGVLTISSWEAAKGIEPHVELTDAITSALSRFLCAALHSREPLASNSYMLVTPAGNTENMQANVEAALTVLKNFTCAWQLAHAYAFNSDLVGALGQCLVYGSHSVRLLTLDLLAHVALLPSSASTLSAAPSMSTAAAAAAAQPSANNVVGGTVAVNATVAAGVGGGEGGGGGQSVDETSVCRARVQTPAWFALMFPSVCA